MASININAADRERIIKAVATEAAHKLQSTDPEHYADQVHGIIDTILNRAASGEYPASISGVLNQKNAFTAINGPKTMTNNPYGSVDNVPSSAVPDFLPDIVNSWVDARIQGAPSSVGGSVNYGNPYTSDSRNRPWVEALNGPRYGVGTSIHYHGTVPDKTAVPDTTVTGELTGPSPSLVSGTGSLLPPATASWLRSAAVPQIGSTSLDNLRPGSDLDTLAAMLNLAPNIPARGSHPVPPAGLPDDPPVPATMSAGLEADRVRNAALLADPGMGLTPQDKLQQVVARDPRTAPTSAKAVSPAQWIAAGRAPTSDLDELGQLLGIPTSGAATSADTSKPAPVYTIAPNAPGMVAPGNIDLNARQVDTSTPGTYRTEQSISVGTDRGEVLIPTIIDGKKVSDAQAIQHFQQTGENLGTFTNATAADTYAQQLHERQAAYYAPADWITQNQPKAASQDTVANPLRNDAWANIVATPSAKPYTGNEPNYVGREVPLPAGYDLPVPQIGNTLGTGTTKTANGISGTVQMPAGARPTSVPTTAPWLPGAKAPSGSALPSKAPWLPMGAALPISGTTMIAQPIAPNFINSPPAKPVTGPTIAATPIKPSDDVRAVQNALKQAGYGVSVDGLMGPQTDAAIRAFQKAQGLVVDGIVGPKTSMALQRSLPVNAKTNPLLGVTFGFTTPTAPTAAPWITRPTSKAPVVVQKAPQQTTAEQHYAQTGTYSDNDPSNNAINFEKNAGKDGFSDFLSGEL